MASLSIVLFRRTYLCSKHVIDFDRHAIDQYRVECHIIILEQSRHERISIIREIDVSLSTPVLLFSCFSNNHCICFQSLFDTNISPRLATLLNRSFLKKYLSNKSLLYITISEKSCSNNKWLYRQSRSKNINGHRFIHWECIYFCYLVPWIHVFYWSRIPSSFGLYLTLSKSGHFQYRVICYGRPLCTLDLVCRVDKHSVTKV